MHKILKSLLKKLHIYAGNTNDYFRKYGIYHTTIQVEDFDDEDDNF